jgi:hypothetical protein
MRQKQMEIEEPEALRKMREEREARERAAQEAKQQQASDDAAAADARVRAETGNFVAGQDLREMRMVEEFKRQQQAPAGQNRAAAEGAGGADIRQKVRAMQGSDKRKRVDKERLLHQSTRSELALEDAMQGMTTLLNAQLQEALGEIVMVWSEAIAAEASKANAWMNGSYRVPRAQVVGMTAKGLVLQASIVRTGFFGNSDETTQQVEMAWPHGRVVGSGDELREALIEMLLVCKREAETAVVLQASEVGSLGWQIPDNLFLNEIPCDPDIRDWFYRDICDAVQVCSAASRLCSLLLCRPTLQQNCNLVV